MPLNKETKTMFVIDAPSFSVSTKEQSCYVKRETSFVCLIKKYIMKIYKLTSEEDQHISGSMVSSCQEALGEDGCYQNNTSSIERTCETMSWCKPHKLIWKKTSASCSQASLTVKLIGTELKIQNKTLLVVKKSRSFLMKFSVVISYFVTVNSLLFFFD